MKDLTVEEIAELAKAAQDILNDPEKYKEFKERSAEFMKLCGFPDLDKSFEELGKRNEEAHKKWAEEHPEQAACDHGVTFDKDAALALLNEAEETRNEQLAMLDPDDQYDPALEFIMGSSAAPEIRHRWPRLCGECPKGCGYNGIAYASEEHYIYGDW